MSSSSSTAEPILAASSEAVKVSEIAPRATLHRDPQLQLLQGKCAQALAGIFVYTNTQFIVKICVHSRICTFNRAP